MYNKVDTNMNFVDREKATLLFWEEEGIFQKSIEDRKDGETYTFYDGPPTANGKPHIGHVTLHCAISWNHILDNTSEYNEGLHGSA